MTSDELAAKIRQADDAGEMWCLLIRHESADVPELYRVEFIGWDGTARATDGTHERDDPFLQELMLTGDEVACTTARDAGVPLLNVCDRCDH